MERDLSLIWQGCSIHLWTMTNSLCSMSRLALWFLLRKITKHTTYSTNVYLKKVFGKARKTSGVVYFAANVVELHTTVYLK